MNHDENHDEIMKILLSRDFSKENPKHKERLRRELAKSARNLSDIELDAIAAAGDPDSQIDIQDGSRFGEGL